MMNISAINSMNRALDKLKNAHEGVVDEAEGEQQGLMANILNSINLIEDQLAFLKLNKNSSAGKILLWFRNFAAQSPEVGGAFKVKSTESNFVITVDCAKAFNLNLSEDPTFDWESDEEEYAEFLNPDDVRRNEQISDQVFFEQDEWMPCDHFDPLLSHTKTHWDFNTFNLTFSMSKKLVKDEEAFNEVMKELTSKIWNKCLEIRNMNFN